MPSYDAAAIDQLLVSESGRIGPDIHQHTLNTSVWLNMVPQEKWPDEMGASVSVLVYERTLPTGSNGWANVAESSGGSGGSCAVPANLVGFAQTLRSYNLQQRALESPDICVNDLRFSFQRDEQLANMFEVLKYNTAELWINRYRDEYVRVAGHKMICTTGLPEDPTAMPETLPTSTLKQSVLDYIYNRLVRMGAAAGASGMDQGAPVFTLITDSSTSEALIKANEDIRQDYREAQPDELLRPLGVNRHYKGFYHVKDDFPPRYSFNSGASSGSKWVRIQHYASAGSATKGTKYDVNPNWEAATYQDSIIYVKHVMVSLIPAPISGVGATEFDPVNYRGEFKWMNIQDRYVNPDRTIGYFRGLFSNGTKTIKPEYGFVIRHLVAPLTLDLDA